MQYRHVHTTFNLTLIKLELAIFSQTYVYLKWTEYCNLVYIS